jgi:autotransporter passenger strand-loop-strand repeat protein
VSAGGQQVVYSGGTASGATLLGTFNVFAEQHVTAGGTAIGTTVNFEGFQIVSSGGIVNDTVVNGGFQRVLFGGSASGTTLNNGSVYVSSGGAALNTVISRGMEFVYGGTESGGHILAGGGLTISGGIAAISGDAGATVTFVGSGGELISNQPDFAAVISGFYGQTISGSYSGDLIDIASFNYSPGTQASFAANDGTLTLTHGNQSTQLHFTGGFPGGSYAARNFDLSNDTSIGGSGGTLIEFRQPPGQA